MYVFVQVLNFLRENSGPRHDLGIFTTMGSRKLEAGSSIFHFPTRQILLSPSLYSFFHASVPSYLVRAESTAEILAAGDWKSIPDAKVIRKKTPRFR